LRAGVAGRAKHEQSHGHDCKTEDLAQT